MLKILNEVGLEMVWGKMKGWALGLFAPRSHSHTDIVGNAGSAEKLTTPHTISLSGAVTGEAIFDGSSNVVLPTTYDLQGAHQGVVPIRGGGTGATTAIEARKSLRIQCGFIDQTIPNISAANYTSIDILFPVPFLSAPIVVLTGGTNTSARMNSLVMNVSTRYAKGFTAVLYNPTTGSSGQYPKKIYWIAVEHL